MTDAMQATAQKQAGSILVEGWTSTDGPPAIQGAADGALAVPPMLELVREASAKGAGAILIGCFDDTGLAKAQEIAACPVIGIGQAGYHLAIMAGGRFSVVTTMDVSVPVLEENIAAYGLTGHLGKVRASGVPVLEIDQAEARVLQEIRAAEAEDDVRAVVLGCGGMGHLAMRSHVGVGVQLIDGVRAATAVASALI
jgi:allantoin racemase